MLRLLCVQRQENGSGAPAILVDCEDTYPPGAVGAIDDPNKALLAQIGSFGDQWNEMFFLRECLLNLHQQASKDQGHPHNDASTKNQHLKTHSQILVRMA